MDERTFTTPPSEGEALSLRAAGVITDLACEEMGKVPGLSFAEACRRVMQREPHLAAGYAGDGERFAKLSANTRVMRLAAPGGRERHFRRAAPPRALSRRPIRNRSELRPGETLCLHMCSTAGQPVMFAEIVA